MTSFSYAAAGVALPALPPDFGWAANGEASVALRAAGTGEILTRVMPAGPNDIDALLATARAAATAWARLGRAERGRTSARFAALLRARAGDLAAVEAWNRGRPVSTVHAYDLVRGERAFEAPPTVAARAGVSAVFVGPNAPLGEGLALGARILASGDAVVIVPPVERSLALLLAAREASPFPAGLLSVVPATSAAQATLAAHAQLDRIVVRGFPAHAAHVTALSAPRTEVRVDAYALGATVVFEDAALDEAVDVTVQTAFVDRPWWCSGGMLVAVAEPVFEDLAARFRARIEALRCGDPADRNTDVALASVHDDEASIDRYSAAASEAGAEIFARGNAVFATGLHSQHHLLRQHAPTAMLALLSFRTADEATALLADCAPLGGASVWSDKGARALAVARRMRIPLAACNAAPLVDGHETPPRRTFVA